MSDEDGLSRERILELFEALDAKLARGGTKAELYIVGGAVMCMAFKARPSTKDVDGYFVPKKAVREAARLVAREFGIDERWLNDAVKGFLGTKGENERFGQFIELPCLKVYAALPEYMLAMKCAAMRLGPEFHDEADVRFLLRYLGLRDPQEAIAIVSRYFETGKIPQKTFYALEEILSEQREEEVG